MQAPPELVRADYHIVCYTPEFYKIVKFHRSHLCIGLIDHTQDKKHDTKLDPALSRARKNVFSLAMCNDWDFFFTGTIDTQKFDRYDLPTYRKKLSQFIRDMRKKYDANVEYLLIPEKHKDGAWHIHGMVRGIPSEYLSSFESGKHPVYLCQNGFLNWPDYASRFGFCSLGRLRSRVGCAFYVSKYITEDLNSRRDELGKHLYYASQGLNREFCMTEVYGPRSSLDVLVRNHYEFCSVGYATKKFDGWGWYTPLEYDDFIPYDFESNIESDLLDLQNMTFAMEQMVQLSYL